MVRARIPAWSFVLLVGLVAVAGCAGNDGQVRQAQDLNAPAPQATFGGGRGGIEGLVTDDEFRPLAGAEVGGPALGPTTLSDAQGRFAFSDLDPGAYELFVSLLGFSAQARIVNVVQEQVAAADFQMDPTAAAVVHSVVLTQRGLFGCGSSARMPRFEVPEPVGGGVGGLAGVAACGLTEDTPLAQYDRFYLLWNITEPTATWQESVFEMQWTSNQLAGRGLLMVWEVDFCYNSAEFTFAEVGGTSALWALANQTTIAGILANTTEKPDECGESNPADTCDDDSCRLVSRVFSDAQTLGSDVDVGLTTQQPFEQFHSAFFWAPAPEGFSAIATT